jgi:peptidoglycan/xylan/chitin deacetylase (PgdA/CDA1 family)
LIDQQGPEELPAQSRRPRISRRTWLTGAGLATATAAGASVGVGYEQYRIDIPITQTGLAVGAHRPPDLTMTQLVYRVPTQERVVALTFDDGPASSYTPAILDTLARASVAATFFFVGEHVDEHPDIARRIVSDGHEVGNHTWSHPNLALADAPTATAQMHHAEAKIATVTGRKPSLFRPPYGAFSGAVAMVAAGFGYPLVLWDVDFDRRRTATIAGNINHIARSVQPGSIILGHDGGRLTCQPVVAALPGVISRLRADGYQFVTVSDLLSRSSTPTRT